MHIQNKSSSRKVLGKSKMGKEDVVAALVDMLKRWDLALIQEVRDASGEAIQELLKRLNAASGNVYELLLSDRLGRSSSKEQLAWFYRKDRVALLGHEQVADPKDVWERPPQITYWGLGEDKVGIIGIHIKPDDAVSELDALASVVDDVVARGKAPSGVWAMGDMNADCSYITKTEWRCIREPTCTKTAMRLHNPNKYVWPIDDDADTTTSDTDCAYDRFVFAKTIPAQVNGIMVYDFGKHLTKEEVKAVSDRYPIELMWNLTSRSVSTYANTAVTTAASTSHPNTIGTTVTVQNKGDMTRKQTSSPGSTYVNTAVTAPYKNGIDTTVLDKGASPALSFLVLCLFAI